MRKLSELYEGTLLYSENSDRVATARMLIDEIESGQPFDEKYHTIRFSHLKGSDEITFLEEVEVDVKPTKNNFKGE